MIDTPPYRVLRMITWLPQGGIERKIAAVLPRLNREWFDVHVCCIRERGPLADELERNGIPVHVIPFRSRWDPIALWRLRRLVRRLEIHLIHSHMYRANVPATFMKMIDPAVMHVAHYHNMDTWESRSQILTDRWLASKRDLNVAVSEAVRQNLVERLHLHSHQTRTLHNCVDLDEFHPISAAGRHSIREKLGFGAQSRLVLMLARLVTQKNHALVVESIPEILAACPRAHFLFAGSGPAEGNLRELVARLGVEQAVTFLGLRNDVAQLIPACDVSVLPSTKEGFSNTVLESMACGVPMVASRVGGNGEIIDHGINGFLVDAVQREGAARGEPPEVNAAQFVRYLKRLLTDDEYRLKIGAAARQQAENFGLDFMVEEIEQLYLELLET